MHWIFLSIAIAFEVTATTFLKLSSLAGLRLTTAAVFTLIFFPASFVFYWLSLSKIDISVAYPIWSGLGTVAIALVGLWVFKEHISLARWIFLCVIVIGVAGLYLTHA